MTILNMSKLFSSVAMVILLSVCFAESASAEVKPVWTRQIGSVGNDKSGGVAVDKDGYKYVAGYTDSWDAVFDGNDPQGDYTDIVLVKYDSAGAKVWSTRYGSGGLFLINIVTGVAVSPNGQYVYVAGYNDYGFYGDFADNEVFVIMFNSSTGAFESMVQFGSPGNDQAAGIVVDVIGNVYVTGHTDDDMDGNGNLGSTDCFLAQLDSNATTVIWTRQFGTDAQDIAGGVAVSTDGLNIYVTGYTYGTMDVNNPNPGSTTDIFLAQLDNLGSEPIWIRQLGTSADDRAHGVAVSADGSNVYVAGYTFGVLGDNVTANAGGADIFLAKYDGTGDPITNPIWKRQLGTNADDVAGSVAVDANGNVFVAGVTDTGLDGNASAGLTDLFLVKYSGLGFKQWTRQVGSSMIESVAGIALDAEGNAFITGNTNGSMNGNNAGLQDMFLVKYDTMMSLINQFGSSSSIANDYATGVAVDKSGNTYVIGYTESGMDGNINAGLNDVFLVKYDNVGVKQWTRQMGTTGDDMAAGVAVDGDGYIYVAGSTQGVLGANMTSNAGGYDIFLAKYSGSGDRQWTQQLGTSSDDMVTGVVSDATGTVYVTGYTGGQFEGNTQSGLNDMFLVKYGSAGNRRWVIQHGTNASNTHARGVAVDASGYVYVTGYTSGGLDGNGSAGNNDVFLMKYDSEGTRQWTQQRGTSADDKAYGLAVSSDGKIIYLTGDTEGDLDGQGYLGNKDIFLMQFDGTTQTGDWLWTRLTGTGLVDMASSVAADKDGNAYLAGHTEGGLAGNINAGMYDMVFVKYNSTGDKQWVRQLGTSLIDTANGSAVDVNGDLYLAGNVASSLLGNPYYGGNDAVLLKYNTGSDTIVPDGSLLINGGASITKSATVSLAVSCADAGGCSQMRFSNDAFVGNPNPKWSLAEKCSTSRNWDITDPLYGGLVSDGTKTVYVQFRDISGNLSSAISTTIILDTTPPIGFVQINSYPTPTATNSILVSLHSNVTDSTGIAEVQLSNDKNTWIASTYQNTMPWQLPSAAADNVMQNVYARFKDYAGNLSSVMTGTIWLDNQAPETKALPRGSGSIGQPIGVTISCTDGSRCAKTYFTTDGSLPTTASTVYSDQTITIQDNTTLQFFSVDDLGNTEGLKSETYGFTQIATRLTILLSTQTIMQSGTIDVSGTLAPYSTASINLKGLPITLTVSNLVTTETFTTFTDSVNGNYLLQDIGKNSSIFNQKGTYGIRASFAGTGLLQPTSSTAQALLVGNSAGYAVIVEGKVPNEEGLASHNKTANRIYQNLLDRGFAAGNIYYYNYNTSQPGVTGAPSKANVQNAIETQVYKKMKSVAAPIWVIMVDHGGPEKFYVGNDSITPADLDTWLTNLEQHLSQEAPQALEEKRIVVVGACYSGSFIPALSSSATTTNAGRLVITSAAASEESYKGPQEPDNVRSGEFFLEEFFNELAKGTSIKTAFQAAADSTRAFTSQGAGAANALNQYGDSSVQHPLLDDNGDGIGTNTITDTTSDGVLADAHYLGVGVTNSAANPADLVAVTEPLYLDSSITQGSLWAKPDVYSYVDTAWIEVKAPSTSLAAKGGTGQLELNIPKTFMLPMDGTKQWELTYGANCGANNECFNEPGKYEIYYFTRNLYTEAISQMKRSVVYKNKAGNHAPTAPALVSPPTGTVTKTSVFLEWGTSTDLDNDPVTYTIEIALNSNFTGTNVVVRREGLTDTWLFVDLEDGLKDQSLYGWRVLAVDAFGANAFNSPNTFTTNNTNIGLPASVSVVVKDAVTMAPIQGATVSFNSSIQKTTDAQGKCGIGLSGGQTVSVSAAKSNYSNSSTSSVIVTDGQGKTQEILLAPLSTTTNKLSVILSGSGGTVVSSPSGIMCGSSCNTNFSSAQSITLTAAAGPGTVFTGWTGDCSGSGTCTVALSSAKNVTASFTAAPSGQVPDGILIEHSTTTAADALRALQIAAGLSEPTAYELEHGDVAPMVNGIPVPDGRIDLGDVIVILRKSVGLVNW